MGLEIPMMGIEPVTFSLDGFRDSNDGNWTCNIFP